MLRLYTTILALSALLFVPTLQAQNVNPEKVSKKLLEAMAESPDAYHSINVVLADRVDFEALDADLRSQRAKAGQRSAAVIQALKEKAAATQGRMLDVLKNSPAVKTGTVGSSWLANALFAEAKNSLIAELSNDPAIEWIALNGMLEYEKAEDALPPPFLEPDDTEPGLRAINAPALWAMGYTGYGQLTMTSDTGVDPNHPALAYHYYGHYVPAEQTWFQVNPDGTPTGNYTPFDNSDHGTHVTGTTLGLDRMTNDTIGVAFNAQWIGALTLAGIGTEDNIGAFEWAVDPDGNPATFEDMPDVINNSWWDPSLDVEDCFSVYRPVMEALETAGIAVVFSAGNGGPGPGTITQPKNININEVNIFAVGNLNGNSTLLTINEGSSRGPSHCTATDSSLVIKPEVSAPGTSVRSSVPGGGYDFKTGTSMAAPHVCGAILLLKEAFPDLTAKDLKLALYHSCTDLGIPGEDNDYGMGIINLKSAFDTLVAQGHVPVPPHRANDVMLVNVFNPPYFCNSEINPTIIVENAGTDTLFSFKVFYKAGATLADYEWTGALPPNERTEVTAPPLAVGLGDHELSISVAEPNGVDDERPLNNNFTMMVTVSDRPRFEAEVEGPSNTACQNTSAMLRGVLPDALQGTGASMDIDWYTAAVGGTLLGNGDVFSTPLLSSDATFYADVAYTVPTGPKTPYNNPSATFDTTDIGLIFDVFYEMTLEKVFVYKDETGGVIVRLLNENNEIIDQSIELSSTTGQLEVDLGWELQPGSYKIVIGGGKPLMYNTEGAAFPYTVPNVLSITGTTEGQDDAYYFFYNWHVKYREPCGRSAVVVEVGQPGMAPAVSYTVSADTVNVDDNEVVDFTSTANTAVEWYWNFGDGATSNDPNPSYTYTVPGIYTTSLTVVDADGCTGSASYPIVAEESTVLPVPPPPTFEQVLVFPNPVREQLSVLIDLPTIKTVTLRLADSTGRIWEQAEHFSNTGVLNMDVHDLPPGVYFLMIGTGENSSVWKVVKM